LSSRRFTAVLIGISVAAFPAVAAAAEEESGGIAALGFNLPGLISQLVNFLILLVVLRLFLYRPLLNMLDQRKQRIEEGLNRAEQAAEQASASEDEARRIMDEARAEGREAIQRSQEAADRLRSELEQRARDDADQIVTRAREEVQAERDRAIQQLHEEFADLTISASERVIGQSLDRTAHQRLIDEVLAGSSFTDSSNGSGSQPGQGDQG
jgi:F-type H+-transporting ATPase subunit b